ncbi:hypothetical protein ABI_46600 [Asticcacaulis biprosthecium C19]|uniref:Uncharacterized protein n=1 Tax=Asticcacaulis biprosthecium C19 TaxID=715226 RepID=F4QU12_9CAUL|nr:hypothetical protein ABI_46600 [Asticcacaulis biprosthecium C19]
MAIGLSVQPALAQDSKQAQFNAEYQRASGLIEYADSEITAGNEAYQKTYWGAACDRFTNGQQALVKASKIYESMLLSANMSTAARDHISTLDSNIRNLIVKVDAKRSDSCSR